MIRALSIGIPGRMQHCRLGRTATCRRTDEPPAQRISIQTRIQYRTMAFQEISFDHHEGFEQGELSGQVRLGKFEEHYEELFVEVIEDGVITREERARLNKAADALGLDRARLRRLEDALQAAYEARHHVRVTEVADE